MLFVGAASYAQLGPVADKFKFVGQTGTSQNAQVHQIEPHRVQDQTNDQQQ
jgi:hypothetical protein